MSVAEMLSHARDVRAKLRGPVRLPRGKQREPEPEQAPELPPEPSEPVLISIELKSTAMDELNELSERVRALRSDLKTIADKHAILVIDEVERRGPSVERIQTHVAEKFKLKRRELISDRRERRVIRPRHMAIWLCRELTTKSLTSLGAMFGKRDHTTILSACRKMERERKHDQQLDIDLSHLLAELSK